jgi:hypothetical protein
MSIHDFYPSTVAALALLAAIITFRIWDQHLSPLAAWNAINQKNRHLIKIWSAPK